LGSAFARPATLGVRGPSVEHAHRDKPRVPLAVPGRRADQPLRPEYLATLVHELGVPTGAGRGAGIRQHVLDMPAPAVADAVGYHHVTTTRLAAQAGATWSR
jgi:hypothetical protein